MNKKAGGSFVGGWVGGAVTGLGMAILPFYGTAAGAFLGSIITDKMDGNTIDLKKAFFSSVGRQIFFSLYRGGIVSAGGAFFNSYYGR